MTDHTEAAREISQRIFRNMKYEDAIEDIAAALKAAAEEADTRAVTIIDAEIDGMEGVPDTEINRAHLKVLCKLRAAIRDRTG